MPNLLTFPLAGGIMHLTYLALNHSFAARNELDACHECRFDRSDILR